MKLKVTTSRGGQCNHQLRIEGAPMMLLMVLNSEGIRHYYDVDSLAANTARLSPLEKELYDKWDGKFDGELEKFGDDESSKFYAMYFISVFSPVFDCTYEANSDEIVCIWNKMNNFISSCGNSVFESRLSELLKVFVAWLKGYFGDLLTAEVIDHDVRLSLFDEPDPNDISPGLLYSYEYRMSFFSVNLSILMDYQGIRYRLARDVQPNDLAFYTPEILDCNAMLFIEYLADLAREVDEGLWPSAMTVAVSESGIAESLVQKNLDSREHSSTKIEIPKMCEAAMYAVQHYVLSCHTN